MYRGSACKSQAEESWKPFMISRESVCINQDQDLDGCDEGAPEIQVKSRTAWAAAVTAASSVRVDVSCFRSMSGKGFEEAGNALAADGQPVNVIGNGILNLKMYHCKFSEPVDVMASLSSTLLLGWRFWKSYGFKLNLRRNFGTIMYSGKGFEAVIKKNFLQSKLQKVSVLIENNYVHIYERKEMDVSQFSSDSCLRHQLGQLI